MADVRKRLAKNVAGDFFVDDTCIDCDTCRQLAPAVFGEAPGTAFVHRQPQSETARRDALHALVCCPTGSIGTGGADDPKSVLDDFPLPIEGPVFYCGFNSPKSYGGNSYFIQHTDGNWLVDAPKFLPRLVRKLETLGGIANIFLTHRDDVADAEQFAQHFGSRRIIDRAESAAQPDAEWILDGDAPTILSPGFTAVPTPGHTAGHMVLLVDDRYLFTGDHLELDPATGRLAAFRDYCWHSWPRQIESMERLAALDFEWIFSGHGRRGRLDAREMKRRLQTLVAEMRDTP